MSYIDGFVLAVPAANREAYRKVAAHMAAIVKDCGALQVVEAWGDDVPEGEVTSFPMAVKRKDDEVVVFSWIVWPDKATRDAGQQKMMQDERMLKDRSEMPFDGKRVIFGGFTPIFDF